MQLLGIQTNLITYSVVISACGEYRLPEGALQLFDEMQQQGIKPKSITCKEVICAEGRILCLLVVYLRAHRLQNRLRLPGVVGLLIFKAGQTMVR